METIVWYKPSQSFRKFQLNLTRGLEVNGQDQSPPLATYMNRARKAFSYADVEGKGFLTRHQYKVAMTVVFGHCPDRWEVKQVFARASNPECLMTFQKFQNCVRKKIDSTRDLIDFESLFVYLDKKLKGYLVVEDLLTAAKEVDLRISSLILESAFKEFDRCRNGYIGMEEFSKMLEDKK